MRGAPQSFGVLLDLLVAATVEHLAAQIEAGVDCVQLFESWAGLLAGDDFRRCVIEPTAKVAAALKARHPNARIIGFPRNAGMMLDEYAERAGVDAVSLDHGVSHETGRSIQAPFAAGPHIFNLGHGIVPETPPEHVAALVEAVRGRSSKAP
jgi:uroporphyrinogen decarboxylase